MTLLEEITKLRELEQSLFPGKWKVDEYNGAVEISPAPKETRVHGYGYGNQGFICDLNDEEYHEYYSEEEQATTAKFIADSRNLAPALLEVLGMIREGDASRLRVAAGNMEYSQPGPFTDHEIEMIKRLQQMAELMEREMEG